MMNKMGLFMGVISQTVNFLLFGLSGYLIVQGAIGVPLYALISMIVVVKLFGLVKATTHYIERLTTHKITLNDVSHLRLERIQHMISKLPTINMLHNKSSYIDYAIESLELKQSKHIEGIHPRNIVLITQLLLIVVLLIISIEIGLVITIAFIVIKSILFGSQKIIQRLEKRKNDQFKKYKANLDEWHRIKLNLQSHSYETQFLNQLQKVRERYESLSFLFEFVCKIIKLICITLYILSIALVINLIESKLDAAVIALIILVLVTFIDSLIQWIDAEIKLMTISNVDDLNIEQFTFRNTNDIHENIYNGKFMNNNHSYESGLNELVRLVRNDNLNISNQFNNSVISIQSLRYLLPDGRLLFDQISFKAFPGQYILVKGDSGSGKSTLIRIISGLTQIQSGEINIDRNKVHSTVDYPYFESGTIMHNLKLVNPNINIEQLNYYLMMLNIKLSLDKELSMNGMNISGGERRKIQLLRALLSNQKILILDEPFRSLDQVTVKKFHHALREQATKFNKTIVIFEHQSLDEALFDNLYQLFNGHLYVLGHDMGNDHINDHHR
ncbi:hypothetical protein BVH56_07365 [Abyssicoccus albus]|uniref:ATP-binding cassette domain-containing protein n=2 Tax=Abyssicoccus albus TaxID=1817405 RepID=UPI00097E19B5|nr:ATP-binding cassette domain-containing protein [Abyssicoccus albus]AQL56749.1 hypothetical protein BVH56_07365 [Abyssicoccus albus]